MRSALGFLTVVGGATPLRPRALYWFPAVGVGVGAAVGGTWWAAGRVWPPFVAACLAVLADLAITGMLHFDGLADSADGLLPAVARQRRLDIMATPDVGAFGVAAVVVTLLLRVAALTALAPSPLLVAGLWALSRTVMAIAAVSLPYARGEGLAAAFRSKEPGPRAAIIAAIGIAGAVGLCWASGRVPGLAAVAVAVLAAAGVFAVAYRRIGGFTGDVLGAAGVIAETAGLLAAGVRW